MSADPTPIQRVSREAWSHATLFELAGVSLLSRLEVPTTLPPVQPVDPVHAASPAVATGVAPAPCPATPRAPMAHGAGRVISSAASGASAVEGRPGPPPPAPDPAPAPPPAPRPAAHTSDSPESRLERLAAEVAECTRCPLHEQGRQQTVFADGSPAADIMFIGEGPGAEEDRQGLPFVGPAGRLLTKIIEAMGFQRDEVYIANVVKCRPPGNRAPDADEMAACMGFLRRQIDAVQPRVIVLLGATAARGLLHTTMGITRMRGRWTDWMGIPVMPTFHPAYLLRLQGREQKEAKKLVWQDVQQVRDRARPPKRPAEGAAE